MLDLDDLSRPLDEEEPSGPDMEYDPEFTELELASQPGEERVVGNSVIPAEEPDYAAVTKAAITLLGRTRDLRITVILANAALRSEGLAAFEETLNYARRSLEDYWDSVHPQLDAEDDNDPTMRVNTVLGLTDRETVLAALRVTPLVESRAFGRFSLRDLLVAEGETSLPADMEAPPSQQTISAAFQDTDPEDLATNARAVDACLEHVKAISRILDDHIGSDAPDLTPLEKMLYDIKRRFSAHLDNGAPAGDAEAPEATSTAEEAPIVSSGRAATKPTAIGPITSPDDVKKAIDHITDYYARYEPSSPIPLLLTRARRLVSADFVTIMRDMAPLGIENVALIGGFSEDEDD
ncbi:type VI secretion system protein TssA [Rhodospirillum sp. A1_3_36]|uniref:type VI secretion system protein TssA n=1 Tax=Rhodospirillum sp. A1_3_36 TaxID=3391666 RepID=UPI0039A650C7